MATSSGSVFSETLQTITTTKLEELAKQRSSFEKSTSGDGDVEMAESFEELPGAKKLAARAEWEKTVFEPAHIDVQSLEAYLDQLFIKENKDGAAAIRELRTKVENFESTLNS